MKKNEVIVLISTRCFPDLGGVAKYVYLQMIQLTNNNFKVIIISGKNKNTKYKKRKKINENCEIVTLPVCPPGFNAPIIKMIFFFFAFFILALINIVKIKRFSKIKLIHAHSPPPTGFVALLTSRLYKIPYFYTLHGLDYPNSIIYNLDIKFSVKYSNTTILISENFKNRIEKDFKLKNIIFIPNSIITTSFYHVKSIIGKQNLIKRLNLTSILDKEDFIISYIGYMNHFHTKVKGMIEFIEAFSNFLLKIENPLERKKIKLIFVGSGKFFQILMHQIKKLKVDDNVFLLGYRNDVQDILAISDLMGLTSALEGFPTVILEAMASKVPCIATNTGDNKSIIGNTGFIVNIGNIKEIEYYLNYFYNLPQIQKENLGKSANKRVMSRYDINKVSKKIIKLYNLNK